MSLVVTHPAEQLFLSNTLGVSGNLVRLFSNNITITASTVVGSITEVSGGGYASITLTSGNWGYTQGTPTVALYNTFSVFSFTGTPSVDSVYGYYVTTSGGALLFAENIPLVAPVNGTQVSVKLRITLQSIQQ